MLRSYSFIFFRNFYGIRVAYKPKLENRGEKGKNMKGIHFPALLEEKIFLEEEFLVSDRGELFMII